MILVHVEHYLNEEGKKYFSKWIIEIREVLAIFNGFMDLQEIHEINGDNSNLLLKFDNLENLKKWSSSMEHNFYLNLLKKFMNQKQKSRIYILDKLESNS